MSTVGQSKLLTTRGQVRPTLRSNLVDAHAVADQSCVCLPACEISQRIHRLEANHRATCCSHQILACKRPFVWPYNELVGAKVTQLAPVVLLSVLVLRWFPKSGVASVVVSVQVNALHVSRRAPLCISIHSPLLGPPFCALLALQTWRSLLVSRRRWEPKRRPLGVHSTCIFVAGNGYLWFLLRHCHCYCRRCVAGGRSCGLSGRRSGRRSGRSRAPRDPNEFVLDETNETGTTTTTTTSPLLARNHVTGKPPPSSAIQAAR